MPCLSIVLAGTPDDPSAFNPRMDVFQSSIQAWFHAGG
jgi:hypothetical protein